jgi:hypothetical protein
MSTEEETIRRSRLLWLIVIAPVALAVGWLELSGSNDVPGPPQRSPEAREAADPVAGPTASPAPSSLPSRRSTAPGPQDGERTPPRSLATLVEENRVRLQENAAEQRAAREMPGEENLGEPNGRNGPTPPQIAEMTQPPLAETLSPASAVPDETMIDDPREMPVPDFYEIVDLTSGDYNNDGVVDDADKGIIWDAMEVQAAEGAPDFPAAADHDGDGVISLVDLSAFTLLYNAEREK